MTQITEARRGIVTDEVEQVAQSEGLVPDVVRRGVAAGRIVVTRNVARREAIPALGIGAGLRVKINANIGTSPDRCDLALEVRKAKAALDAGADTVMDLSTGGDLDAIRARLLDVAPIVFGSVPIYQAVIDAQRRRGAILHMTEDDIFNAVTRHLQDGVDFITVHCGVTRESVDRVIQQQRLLGVVSRGGTFLTAWIKHHDRENPLYANFDYLLELAKAYDATLSLGDGLRPGCIHDATDRPQIQELIVIGELVDRARDAGVQCMVEGPGHIPLDEVAMNVQLAKRLCGDAPFYVLGPLVTDVAPGYDHIVGAIGGATAAMAGADFLCYVTPAEHIGLPTVDDVRAGVIVTRIAAHAADVAARERARNQDRAMAKARADLDWATQQNLALDRKMFQRRRAQLPETDEPCTMCGEYCAIKLLKPYLRAEH